MIIDESSIQKLNGKDKKLNIQGKKIHGVLEQVSEILCHLLEDLNYIYKANGIKYIVQNYHTTLIRLLTPFQLLTQFGMADNSELIQCQQMTKSKNIKNQFTQQTNKSQKGSDLKLIPVSQQKKRCRVSKANKKYYYRDRSKPILDQNIEDQLVEWAMNKLLQNQKVRRKDLARKALKLNPNQNGFAGSLGWVRRFLERHPQLQKQMKRTSYIRKKNRSNNKVEWSSSDQSNNLQFEQSTKKLNQNDSTERIDQQLSSSDENDEYQPSKNSMESENKGSKLRNYNYYQPQKKEQIEQNQKAGNINSLYYDEYLDHHKNWNSYGRNKQSNLNQRYE